MSIQLFLSYCGICQDSQRLTMLPGRILLLRKENLSRDTLPMPGMNIPIRRLPRHSMG